MESAPTVKPILLFYGLTQTSRALTAARVLTPDWQGKTGHGLRMSDPARGIAGANAYDALDGIVVTEHGNGFFQQVARLVGSPTLPGPTALGDVVAPLNDEGRFGLGNSAYGPVRLFHHGPPLGSVTNQLQLAVWPVPDAIATERMPPQGELLMEDVAAEFVSEWLSTFPTLAALGPPEGERCAVYSRFGSGYWEAHVSWRLPSLTETADVEKMFADLCDEKSGDDSGVVRPSLGQGQRPLHPLVAWWAILYALSMLARYHPEDWLAMLDVDRSRVAVPLEAVLAVAEYEVPSLLVGAIDGGEQQG